MISRPQIVLSTLNARYIHASLGLRYLKANLDRHGRAGLQDLCVIREYTIKRPPEAIATDLLETLGTVDEGHKQILGLGVYIWNVAHTEKLIRLLKQQRPSLTIVLGGPEVSHELAEQAIVALADHVITGWGDVSFAKLCRALLDGPQPLMKVWPGEQPSINDLELPYSHFSASDLRHRVLYVEASRGCPFKCAFCLSALDKTAWAFELDRFLAAMEDLYRRGARQFKFVDRTFNLKVDQSARILLFFLEKLAQQTASGEPVNLALHFELIPDHLPDRLKELLVQFPPGVLQFELGVQTLNTGVQSNVSRKQNNTVAFSNLAWLKTHTQAHLHVDLIFGLPGEDLASFASGFDRLLDASPHEIQLGVLKRLRGAPIARHTVAHQMVYEPHAPYAVIQTGSVSSAQVLHFKRAARYWDLIANSGRFKRGLALLQGLDRANSGFMRFWAFSEYLWARHQRTDSLTPEVLLDALFDYLCSQGHMADAVREALLNDYIASGANNQPECLAGRLVRRPLQNHSPTNALNKRQQQHASQQISM